MKHIRRFSLVELLTVIVIASILLAIAVPAVSSMIRGSASTQAGRELMSRIRAAKAHAASNQTPVAIVFYTMEKPGSAVISPDYICSAYRICTVKYVEPTKENGGWKGWVFQNWVSDWYFLPKGIAVGLPETMTSSLPSELSDVNSDDSETEKSLIRIIEKPEANDSSKPEFFRVDSEIGVSPVYKCDLSDIYPGYTELVTFRNAIVFNANGMMAKPKNLSLQDKKDSLVPERAVVIPLRTAVISKSGVTVEGEPKEFIPVRIDPSGKTYFYDGFISF